MANLSPFVIKYNKAHISIKLYQISWHTDQAVPEIEIPMVTIAWWQIFEYYKKIVKKYICNLQNLY